MMTRQQFLKTYDTLSPAARKQVEKLVNKLASTPKTRSRKRTPAQDFGPGDEIFGMWRDRDDMKDPAIWIRELRRRQWGRRIGRVAD